MRSSIFTGFGRSQTVYELPVLILILRLNINERIVNDQEGNPILAEKELDFIFTLVIYPNIGDRDLPTDTKKPTGSNRYRGEVKYKAVENCTFERGREGGRDG